MRWHAIFDYIGLKISHHRLEHKFAFYHTDAKKNIHRKLFIALPLPPGAWAWPSPHCSSPSALHRINSPYDATWHVEDLAQVCEAQRRSSLMQVHLFFWIMAMLPFGLLYCTKYSYMYKESGEECTLWLLEQHGHHTLISFYSPGDITEFHGEERSSRVCGDLVTELRFNYRGHVHSLQTSYLVQVGINPRSFDGFDSAARLISMQELRRYYWHEKLEFWIRL